MYSFTKIIIILLVTTSVFAEEYKGHYKVAQPKHIIDFEAEMEKQKNK